MEIDEYFEKHTHLTMAEFCRKFDVTYQSLYMLKNNKRTANLITAMKIHYATEGKVSYLDLLHPDDEKYIEDYRKYCLEVK